MVEYIGKLIIRIVGIMGGRGNLYGRYGYKNNNNGKKEANIKRTLKYAVWRAKVRWFYT